MGPWAGVGAGAGASVGGSAGVGGSVSGGAGWRESVRSWGLTPLVNTLVVALTLVGGVAVAAPPTGEVREVRQGEVYVNLGRSNGVRVGDTLTGAGGLKLEVTRVGERQLVAKAVGGRVKAGAAVTAPREMGAAMAKRPVATLPGPDERPATLPWADAPARRAKLIPTPGGGQGAPEPTGVRGEFWVSYAGILDQGDNDLDLHQAEVRSKLFIPDVAELLGGRLDYRHDIAGRLELGPNLDRRQGADSRPYYRIRTLELRFRSAGWDETADQSPFGAVEASVGRIHLVETPSVGLLDGVRAELALGQGFSAGVHGGLAPRLNDTGLSTDTSVVGGHATWARRGEAWQARTTLTTAASFFRGSLNRVDIGVNGGLQYGRLLDLYATAVGTLVDDTLLPDGQPASTLSRGFVGARVRPLWWLTVDAHYAHNRIVADREMVERFGADRWITDPRESAWLQVRFDPSPMLSVSVSGNYGFGYSAAEQEGGAARVVLRDLALDESRLALGYRFNQTRAVRTQVADVDLGVPLGDVVEVGLGYGFTTFQSRLLDERQDEHRVGAGVDLIAGGPWRVHVRGEVAFGHLPSQVLLTALLGWRFR